ncbi:MAG: penicillin-binding protein 1A [Gallionella sp.]
MLPRRLTITLLAIAAIVLLPFILLSIAVVITYPTLPTLEVLTDYHPKVPLRVYSQDGALLGEFGEERRALVTMAEVPDLMKKAILAAEDDAFYQHGGVDYTGVLRAAIANLTGGAKQGASTITMQVARNFFLTKEKTLSRKFNEVLLTFKIESALTKDEILQLYINQIYLGQRAYGFASASQVYFGKPLNQLSTAEFAMLAGLPKAPSSFNPVVNPKRAKLRQMYVLRRMHQLNFIDDAEFQHAQTQPLDTKHSATFEVKADYLAEMVRAELFEKFGEATYTQGLKVYTTLRAADQVAAYQAVRSGVLDYDHRHGYRGPEGFVDLAKVASDKVAMENLLDETLQGHLDNDDLVPAVVTAMNAKSLIIYTKNGVTAQLENASLHFVERSLNNKAPLAQRIKIGSVVRVQLDEKGAWQITQLPQVEAAFVSGNPQNGAIYALVGGFDFNRNQFNHIAQAWRQPGSSIKPFIYSASLEKGLTPATVINDAPLEFTEEQTGSDAWQPKNYDGGYEGPMRMRAALIKSKNLVSIRILQTITPQYAQDYLAKFGFDPAKHPPYLTMALGAGTVTPMQMLTGYSTFANGGYKITPYFIERVEDDRGNVLSKAAPLAVGAGAEQIIDTRNAFTMVSMMQDVVKHGTAIRAMQLGRQDLAGKTGTTSDSIDAWFCGFQPTVVGISWIGFDQPHSLGDKETGGGAALPMWMNYMKVALKDIPQATYPVPEGIVTARINEAGQRDENGGRTEYFYSENLPRTYIQPTPDAADSSVPASETIKDQLF